LFWCGLALRGFAADGAEAASPLADQVASNRVHRLYLESQHRWQDQTNSAQAAWQFARACFDRADFAVNDSERARFAEEGITASRRAIALEPNSAAAHYYLGLNLGELAQTKMLGALKLIEQMETAWKRAVELDEKFDYAGPHRSLGLLYLDAPGWSVGSRTNARRHLQKAVELFPDFPDNRLCLLEAQLKWGETRAVQGQIAAVEELLRTARGKLTGEEWVREWQDWDRRWRKIKAKASPRSEKSKVQGQ
jgi:tetratricopeptide (TPR) repeat protein